MITYTISEKIRNIPKWTEYCRNCYGINKTGYGYFCSMSCANTHFYADWVNRLLKTLENLSQKEFNYIMEINK